MKFIQTILQQAHKHNTSVVLFDTLYKIANSKV